MDKETREFLNRKFNTIDEKFEEARRYAEEKFEENKRYTEQKIDENKRYFGVVAEGLRNEIRQVAEGHQGIRNEIQTLREENDEAHREILSAIKFSYAELDQRIRVLETNFQALKLRLDRLEAGRN